MEYLCDDWRGNIPAMWQLLHRKLVAKELFKLVRHSSVASGHKWCRCTYVYMCVSKTCRHAALRAFLCFCTVTLPLQLVGPTCNLITRIFADLSYMTTNIHSLVVFVFVSYEFFGLFSLHKNMHSSEWRDKNRKFLPQCNDVSAVSFYFFLITQGWFGLQKLKKH